MAYLFFDFLNKVAVPVLIVRQPNQCHAKVWFAITWLLNGFRVACTDTITCPYIRQPPTANSRFTCSKSHVTSLKTTKGYPETVI